MKWKITWSKWTECFLLLFAFIHFVFVLLEQCFFVRIFLSQCNKFLFKFNQHQNKPKSQCNVCQQISVDRWLCWQIWMIRRNIAQFNITTYRLNYQQINKKKKKCMAYLFVCFISKLDFSTMKMACTSFVGKYLHTYSEYTLNLWQLFETKTICYFLFNKNKIFAWKRMITSPKSICKYELNFRLKTLQFNWEDAKFYF